MKRIFSLKILCDHLRFELHTARVWLGMGMGMALCVQTLQGIIAFSAAKGEPLNIMEGFLYCILDPQNSMLIVLGYLFLISDAPFVNERTLQVVVRSLRKSWNTGCWLYIVLQACFYYAVVLGFSMILLRQCGYWGDAWSVPTVQVAKNINLMSFNYQVSFPFWDFMKENTVITGAILAWWGNVLYASMLGGILYLGNLGNRYSLGTWAAVALHFTGYITRKEWNSQWSLQCYASPAENGNFYPLYIILLLVILVSCWRVKRIDYHIMDKDV